MISSEKSDVNISNMNILEEQILLASNFFLSFPDLGYCVGVFLINSHLCFLIIMNFDFF